MYQASSCGEGGRQAGKEVSGERECKREWEGGREEGKGGRGGVRERERERASDGVLSSSWLPSKIVINFQIFVRNFCEKNTQEKKYYPSANCLH